MYVFQVVETFLDAPLNLVSAITDIEVVVENGALRVYSAGRAGGGVLAFDVGARMSLIDQRTLASATLPALTDLSLVMIGAQLTALVTGPNDDRLGGFALRPDGGFGDDVTLAGTPGGAIGAQTVAEIGGGRVIYLSPAGSSEIHVCRMPGDGGGSSARLHMSGTVRPGLDVTALEHVRVGATDFLAAASLGAEKVSFFQILPDGALRLVSHLGADGGFGIAAPADLASVEIAGQTYLLVAATGSSSISVLRMDEDGSVTLADHVVDTLDTRFMALTTIETVTVGDRVFVIAGGGDGGLTLFALLPGGRLVQAGQVLNAPGMALHNIGAIRAVVVDGRIEVYAAGEGSGITRLGLDPMTLALIQQGSPGNETMTGGAADDLLVAGAGADVLYGQAGADILMDGAGRDTMFGGADADLFVLSRDGEVDIIRDFQIGVDRIDLTAWGRIFAVEALAIRQTPNGASIIFGTEQLTIYSGNGQPIPVSAWQSGDLFGLWHVEAPPPAPGLYLWGSAGDDRQAGGAGNDWFSATPGADTIMGGEGRDTLDFGAADRGQLVDLADPAANRGLAEGDAISGIERIDGSAFADTLRGAGLDETLAGGGGADQLVGRGGNDVLMGGDGDDRLEGGAGRDVIDGGAGRDVAVFAPRPLNGVGLTIDLQSPLLGTGEAWGDVFVNIELIVATAGRDRMYGNAAANGLSGSYGHDLLSGRGGNDTLRGGGGQDTLMGGPGNDLLVGGTGADRFVFTGGRDVIDDFWRGQNDRILIDDALLPRHMTPERWVQSHARVVGGDVVIGFGGGNVLVLDGIANLHGLANWVDDW